VEHEAMTESALAVSEKTQIMIVEDDPDLSELLHDYFSGLGYEVLTAAWGEDAVRLTKEHTPSLVVLDVRLPDIDGFEVCRRIRSTRRTQEIPVIFLTEKRDRSDKLTGLELGVVDYITKPFDMQELRLRVRNILKRAEQTPIFNSVTNIAEGPLVDEKLTNLLTSKAAWAAVSVGIRGLDAFREIYGFVNSDDVLRAVTLMMNNAIRELGNDTDFVGHLNPVTFVVISTTDKLSAIRKRVETRIAQAMEYFYPLKDREKARMPETKGHLRLVVGQVESGEAAPKTLEAFKTALIKD
jgi:PleD family two-component response regulator